MSLSPLWGRARGLAMQSWRGPCLALGSPQGSLLHPLAWLPPDSSWPGSSLRCNCVWFTFGLQSQAPGLSHRWSLGSEGLVGGEGKEAAGSEPPGRPTPRAGSLPFLLSLSLQGSKTAPLTVPFPKVQPGSCLPKTPHFPFIGQLVSSQADLERPSADPRHERMKASMCWTRTPSPPVPPLSRVPVLVLSSQGLRLALPGRQGWAQLLTARPPRKCSEPGLGAVDGVAFSATQSSWGGGEGRASMSRALLVPPHGTLFGGPVQGSDSPRPEYPPQPGPSLPCPGSGLALHPHPLAFEISREGAEPGPRPALNKGLEIPAYRAKASRRT